MISALSRLAVLEAVDLRDVGMIEGGERVGLPREAGAAFRIGATESGRIFSATSRPSLVS